MPTPDPQGIANPSGDVLEAAVGGAKKQSRKKNRDEKQKAYE